MPAFGGGFFGEQRWEVYATNQSRRIFGTLPIIHISSNVTNLIRRGPRETRMRHGNAPGVGKAAACGAERKSGSGLYAIERVTTRCAWLCRGLDNKALDVAVAVISRA